MEYSINIDYIAKTMSMEKAARLVSQTGFTALDYTPPVTKDNWEQLMYEHLDIFTRNNLHVHQTHAPFNRYNHHKDKHLLFCERALTATKELNATYMAVHGDEFPFAQLEYTPERALTYNYDLFAPFVEKATAWNFGIAFENVFVDMTKPRFCSDVLELKTLIERYNTPTVSCCWDFGHANVAFGKEQPQKMAQIAEYISCTHIHDNYYGKDLHLPPFFGEINWEKCMEVLKHSHYQGNLNFEFGYAAIPEILAKDYLKQFYKTGVILRDMIIA